MKLTMPISIDPKKHYTDEQVAKMFGHRVQWVEKLIVEGAFAKDATSGLISGAALWTWLDRFPRVQPKRPRLMRAKQKRLGLISELEDGDCTDRFSVTLICGSYVYFLLDAHGGVMYVGKTVCLYARIAQHWNEGKSFHHVGYRAVSIEQLEEEELRLIEKYNPPLNRVGRGGIKL